MTPHLPLPADDEPTIAEVPQKDLPLEVPATPAQVRIAQHQNGIEDTFPMVALGGSAGSLKAFEQFFRHMRPDSGMAFVVITHLSPNQESEMAAVLQHFTNMPVQEATDGLKVQPNHVYVIPPNRDMSILHGTLLLFAPTQHESRRMPIDYFFQSMAKDARERAVCIICSGMGSDGTIGLKMVMENFGMVMVQSPDTAEYDSMPRSAIATEFVDYVLPADQLPDKLLEYVAQPLLARPRREVAESNSKPAHALQKIFSLIRTQTGHDFSFYKRNTVFRRIERRMNSHQIREFTQYVRFLQENPAEVDALFKELLIGVTKFFRDQEAFDNLKARLMPLLRAKPVDSVIRVWAPGCSTGEEAYSLAMCLFECLDAMEENRHLKIQIFATDINKEGIDFARAGIYPESIAADVSPERLNRFFTSLDGHYQIKKEVRDVVIFALHNLTKDAPFTKLDLLVCRNLLIYLSAELQKSILPVFHYALSPGGLLFLGPSENLNGFQDLFSSLDVKWKILRRLEGPSVLSRILGFPFSTTQQQANHAPATDSMHSTSLRKDGTFATLVQRLLLRQYTPPAVVVNPTGEILYVNGRTGRYLEPAPGLSGMNIFEMAREELNYEMSAAVQKAASTRQDVVAENVKVKTDLGVQLLRVTVKCLEEPDQLAGLLLVVFEEQPTPRKVRLGQAALGTELSRDAVVASLEKELQFTKHRLQTTIEEMESSVEELKSTNEELQSANEELQSTNEEAMTNKEEMQSLNEELMTLNMQYLSKTEELSLAANDMKNLLDATEIATIFLDNDMIIKRFTPRINRIISLMPSDVGRPITHFASTLRHENLAQDVKQVLDRLVSSESNIQTTTGEWYAMRILPYRTLDNYISGAVITFTDITSLKNLEAQLQESSRLAETVVETVREPLLVLDYQLRVLAMSQSFGEMFGLNIAGAKGRPLAELDNGTWQQPELRERLEAILKTPGTFFDDLRFKATFPAAGPRELLMYGRCIGGEQATSTKLLLGVRDVTPAVG
ncbi:CheR family methyltransferase [Hymenobacter sp. BT770]|uniref:CheR family methyltransferase n=1 Tax=Hymenobacter sp. BT770 TaxID=2886942 RepID=UPI001D116D31|nr:CheR family methyltransferase [Hymenobacter sp. BT770]MCC3152074.1 PAS domain-containing protein [Hymenobacter sp. BT770]MDO3415243.1 CheR family methyltransferase [Hymenobacter sp. BT770]